MVCTVCASVSGSSSVGTAGMPLSATGYCPASTKDDLCEVLISNCQKNITKSHCVVAMGTQSKLLPITRVSTNEGKRMYVRMFLYV